MPSSPSYSSSSFSASYSYVIISKEINYLLHQGFCCSFNTQFNGFDSKVSNENTREDLDYEDFRNPQNEEVDNWEELADEKEEVIDNEEAIDNPFRETMRSGGLVSRFSQP